jgi:uncharacterized membrane protein YkoI
MIKRVTAILLLVCMVLALLAGCHSDKAITREDAEKIALNHMGLEPTQVDDVDIHVTTHDGEACYSVYVLVGSETTEIVIHGKTGDVLHAGEVVGGHSHDHEH